jgi:hypothetical protein
METGKVTLVFKFPESKTVLYNDVEIKVVPFLSFAQQVFLINAYTETYFSNEEVNLVEDSAYNFLDAEYGLMNRLFQMSTNVEVEGLDNDIFADSSLLDKITGEISNYKSFRRKLDTVVNEIKEQKVLNNSIGKVVSDLIERAYTILDKLSDLTPEAIEQAKVAGMELLKRAEESSLFGNFPGEVPAIIAEAPKKKAKKSE